MAHVRGSSFVLVAMIAAALGSVAGTASSAASHALFAEEMDDRAAEIRDLVKAGDDTALVARIRGLDRTIDKRIDDSLMVVVRASGVDAATREAMRVLGLHGDTAYLAWAKSRLGDKKMSEDRPVEYMAMLDSLPAAGVALKPHLRAIAGEVSDTLTKEPDVARRLVAAYAAAGAEKPVIDSLVEWLQKLDRAATSGGGGQRGGLNSGPPEAGRGTSGGAKSTQAVKDEILARLADLTGTTESDADGWTLWWSAHRASFKPAPPKKPEPLWETLAEFADDTFGFVLRKPVPDKNWVFAKCDAEGGRVRLEFRDASGLMARVDVVASRREKSAAAASVAQRAGEAWKKSDFSDFFGGGEPAVAAEKIGGRDFSVVTARGIGAGDWSAWDGCERRLYVTLGDADTVLTFDTVARAGFAAAQKEALWACIRAVEFPQGR